MGGKKPAATCINGFNNEGDVANEFAKYFEGIRGVPSNKSKGFSQLFQDRIINYTGDSIMNTTIDVELVDNVIKNLDRGKAVGDDGLSCEHLLYHHPIIVISLTKLFKLMLNFQYVPDAFGIGIIMLIPKTPVVLKIELSIIAVVQLVQ